MNANQSHSESQQKSTKVASVGMSSPLQLDSDTPPSSSPVPFRASSFFHRVPLISFFFLPSSSGLLALLLPARLRLSLARPPASLVCWNVLGLAALLQLVNGIQCISFGPIANTAEAVFGWSDPVIMLLNGIGAVLMIPLSLPVAWFVEHIGKRQLSSFDYQVLILEFQIMLFMHAGFCGSFNNFNNEVLIIWKEYHQYQIYFSYSNSNKFHCRIKLKVILPDWQILKIIVLVQCIFLYFYGYTV